MVFFCKSNDLVAFMVINGEEDSNVLEALNRKAIFVIKIASFFNNTYHQEMQKQVQHDG